MLSLSSIETRDNELSKNRTIAQSNARMALMVAIGQLQQSMGPDQRVSASASIFDTDPTTAEIDGVNLPHTLGAWSTLTANGDPIIYQTDDGYHMDHRNPSDTTFEDHRENVISWLISGGEQTGFDPRTSSLQEGTTAITLGFDNGQKVMAPLVNTVSSDGATNKYAYHVTDLGMTTPVVQLNTKAGTLPSASSPNDGGYANLYGGSKRPLGDISDTKDAFSGIADDATVINENATTRYITNQTLGFTPDGISNDDAKELLRLNDQSFSFQNTALLVDTLRGGFRTDLSSFLHGNEDPGDGSLVGSTSTLLTDLDPILPHDNFKVLSPKFGALRDFLRLGDLAGSSRSIDPRAPIYGNGGYQNDYPDPTQVFKQGVHPHIIEYSSYHLPVENQASTSNVSTLIYPRVTLWNPYNVTIKASNYFVQINQRDTFAITVKPASGSGDSGQYSYSATSGTVASGDGSRARPDYLFFFLEPIDIEPGQSLVFTAAHSGSKKLEDRDGNLSQNILSATANPSDLASFYVDMTSTSATSPDFNTTLEYTFNGTYFVSNEESTSARLRLASGNSSYSSLIGGSDEAPNAPIVHTFDIHNWVRDNQMRFRQMDNSDPPLLLNITDTPSLIPDHRTKLGMRLKAFNETPENLSLNSKAPWDFPLIEMSNMRSPFYRRTSWDWIIERAKNGSINANQEFHFGPFATETTPAPSYTDSFMIPRYTGGVAETSPFMNSSSILNLRFPLFDIPPADMEAYSFAQLRPATLTHEFSAPSFIIGESLVPVTSPRDRSALSLADYEKVWWDGVRPSQVTSYATWWQDELDPSVNYSAYDLRYEVNHALWDKYFLSSIPNDAILADHTDAGSIPNQHIQVSTATEEDLTQTTASKPDLIAQHLRLNNHHSVNSTNLIAWKSLLSKNMGVNINGRNTDSDSVPFPGMSTPLGDGANPTSSEEMATWIGYRQLNPVEINLLAENIVEQVKRRAPFISISDFVNRRLIEAESASTAAPDVNTQTDIDLLSYAGPIEIAIRKADINAGLQDYAQLAAAEYETPVYKAGKQEVQPYKTINTPEERFANAPAHLTQGKILETIGSTLTSRSDTFRIRAYGESRDVSGRLKAAAWCEAIVQRSTTYLDSVADDAIVAADDLTSDNNKKYGRRFLIKSFRWMAKNELNFD